MMIVFRLLIFIVLIDKLSAHEPLTFPKSASFHRVLEFVFSRTKILPTSISLSSVLSSVINDTNCFHDLSLLVNGFTQKEMWALKIIDSWGIKPPTDILEGSHLWLGSYDECLRPLYLINNHSHVIQPYPTKYCILSNINYTENEILVVEPKLIIGICLPDSCHSQSFQNSSISILCNSDNQTYSIGAIFTICLIIVLCLFVFVSSFIPCLYEYSMISTLKRMFNLKSNSTDYAFLNGIRVLSLCSIVLGHSFLFQMILFDNVVHVFDNLQNSFLFQLIPAAVFSVDTFFFISGFLSVSSFLHIFDNHEKFRLYRVGIYVLHRYWRLIPTLAFVLLISVHLTSRMGNGPIYPSSLGFEVAACRQQWWTTLLFVNNLVKPEDACLPVTWYLANDFQFHLLASIVLIPFIINRRYLSYVLLFILLLINIFSSIYVIGSHPEFEFGMDINNLVFADYFDKFYIKPWCRIGPFILGMIMNLFLEQYESRLSRAKQITFTILSIILALVCIFFPYYSHSSPKFIRIIYQSLSHQCWALSISWLIFFCYTNRHSIVNKLLSWPVWTIAARLSYSIYLIHTIVILAQVYNRLSTIHYQFIIILNNFIGQMVASIVFSIFVIILVEMPCYLVEKQLRQYYKDRKEYVRNRQSYESIN